MIVPEHLGFGDLDDYEVVGPQGELYGRYKTYPTAEQIPLYALVHETKGFTLSGAGQFSGQVKVVDPSGRPISGLMVTLLESTAGSASGTSSERSMTDPQGVATFSNVSMVSFDQAVYEIEGRGILKKIVKAVPDQAVTVQAMVLI